MWDLRFISEGKRPRPPRKTAHDLPVCRGARKEPPFFQSKPQRDAASPERGWLPSPPHHFGQAHLSQVVVQLAPWEAAHYGTAEGACLPDCPCHLPSSHRGLYPDWGCGGGTRAAENGSTDRASSCGRALHYMGQCLSRRQFVLLALCFVDQCLMQVASWRLIGKIQCPPHKLKDNGVFTGRWIIWEVQL